MRNPAQIKANPDTLRKWVNSAENITDYRYRTAIWLSHKGLHAHKVAENLCISKESVWAWIRDFKETGIGQARKRTGHGGRRQGLLTLEEERATVSAIERRAKRGTIRSVKALHDMVSKRVYEKTGHSVSLAYVYRLLHRHGLEPKALRQAKKRGFRAASKK